MQEQITPALYSQNLKTKSQTYFFDVREAKNGTKYLNISQSWTTKDGEKKRSTLTIFSGVLNDFNQAFAQALEKVK
jgi:hypothetical protein